MSKLLDMEEGHKETLSEYKHRCRVFDALKVGPDGEYWALLYWMAATCNLPNQVEYTPVGSDLDGV